MRVLTTIIAILTLGLTAYPQLNTGDMLKRTKP
jgi:hypothetical protein